MSSPAKRVNRSGWWSIRRWDSPRQLPGALSSLREAVRLGRTFYPERSVHGTWQFRLERLLDQIGREEAENFLRDLSPAPFWEEGEWRRTLETFSAWTAT